MQTLPATSFASPVSKECRLDAREVDIQTPSPTAKTPTGAAVLHPSVSLGRRLGRLVRKRTKL